MQSARQEKLAADIIRIQAAVDDCLRVDPHCDIHIGRGADNEFVLHVVCDAFLAEKINNARNSKHGGLVIAEARIDDDEALDAAEQPDAETIKAELLRQFPDLESHERSPRPDATDRRAVQAFIYAKAKARHQKIQEQAHDQKLARDYREGRADQEALLRGDVNEDEPVDE